MKSCKVPESVETEREIPDASGKKHRVNCGKYKKSNTDQALLIKYEKLRRRMKLTKAKLALAKTHPKRARLNDASIDNDITEPTPQTKMGKDIELKNRYEPLSRDAAEMDTTNESEREDGPGSRPNGTMNEASNLANATESIESKQTSKPPPIILHMVVTEHKKMVEYLKKYAINSFALKYTRERVHIQAETMEDFQSITTALDKENNMPYHTFTTRDQQQNTYVAKGLPADATEDEITEELSQKYNLAPARCTKMKNTRRTVFVISFKNEITLKHLEKARCIAYTRVSWERYVNAKRLSQCHRCQEWGHATRNCRVNPRCLICANSHLTVDCKLKGSTDSDGVKCANCGDKHPANSIDCPVYKKKIEWLDSRKRTNQPATNNKRPPPIASSASFPRLKPAPPPATNAWTVRANRIAAEAAPTPASSQPTTSTASVGVSANKCESGSGSANVPKDPMTGVNALMSEFNKLNKLINVNRMLSLVTELNKQLEKCNTFADQFICFNNFCQQLDG